MQNQEAKLFVIATPLGHRDDLSLRAREVLGKLKVLFAEDTRETKKLLGLHGIPMSELRLFSSALHNLEKSNEKALEFLRNGQSVGVVCDRGTPGISDPGAELVRLAHAEGIPVVPIPGASSVTALVSVSGVTQFSFVGFLPQKAKDREALWDRSEAAALALLFFESPQRIRKTAKELAERFPTGRLFVGREMTKVFEEYRWHRLSDLNPEDLPEQGEYSLLLAFGEKASRESAELEKEIEARLGSDKDWAKRLAPQFGLSSHDIYNQLQRAKNDRKS
ncbi:MAG: rRNA small subunit methyltransferase 1 [Bdellovibrionaceae bacterium]|nr:rRNA small subunit methyltransferase 1 [Bdellovibrionales bacterium]MCB9254814.1 rRNA small subunit methyltransferase 1 [Pseudobdellovibrionaceae bacterium]